MRQLLLIIFGLVMVGCANPEIDKYKSTDFDAFVKRQFGESVNDDFWNSHGCTVKVIGKEYSPSLWSKPYAEFRYWCLANGRTDENKYEGSVWRVVTKAARRASNSNISGAACFYGKYSDLWPKMLIDLTDGKSVGEQKIVYCPSIAESGFRADAKVIDEQLEMEKLQSQAQRKKAEIEKFELDLPRMKKIGAKICRQVSNGYDGFTEIGYVENISDQKLQIRVSHIVLTSRPSAGVTPRGWHPSIIWDYPNNWRLCE